MYGVFAAFRDRVPFCAKGRSDDDHHIGATWETSSSWHAEEESKSPPIVLHWLFCPAALGKA